MHFEKPLVEVDRTAEAAEVGALLNPHIGGGEQLFRREHAPRLKHLHRRLVVETVPQPVEGMRTQPAVKCAKRRENEMIF